MNSINIDEFFADAAQILTRLQRSFPQPIILQVDDICGPEETDEFGMHSARYLACFAAMLWLADEGYLRYNETVRSEAIDEAVLSARCFVLLTQPNTDSSGLAPSAGTPHEVPDSVALERSSLGNQLQSNLRPRDSLALNAIMLRLMQRMLEVRLTNDKVQL